MALKAVVEKIDEVPEALRGEYVEKDGKFHLGVEGLPDVGKLQQGIDKERADRKKFESELKELKKSWEKLGKTPDELQGLIERETKAEEERLERAGEWEKLKKQMVDKHEEELKLERAKIGAKDELVGKMKSSLESYIVDAQATAAIAAHKGEPLLLLPAVRNRIRVVETDGKYGIKVVDGKGDPMVNGKGDPISISDLVAELKSDPVYGRAFDGSGNSGSGMRPGATGAGPAHITKRSDFKNEAERAAYINQYGLDAYKALPMR